MYRVDPDRYADAGRVTGATAYNLTAVSFGINLYPAAGTGGINVSVYNNNGSVPETVVAARK